MKSENWKHLGGEVPWIFTEPKTCYRKIVFPQKKNSDHIHKEGLDTSTSAIT